VKRTNSAFTVTLKFKIYLLRFVFFAVGGPFPAVLSFYYFRDSEYVLLAGFSFLLWCLPVWVWTGEWARARLDSSLG